MSTESFLKELTTAWNTHDPQRLLDMYHPDFSGEDMTEAKYADGLGKATRMIDYILKAFPDLEMEISESGRDGDKIFFFWQATGHHRGKLMNIPPTGKKCSFMGASFFTLKDGKIIKSRRLWDVAAMLRQIGLLPESSASAMF